MIEKGESSFGAYVPDLPGCIAAARTEKEVRQLIKEAIELHIEGLRDSGEPIPPPSSSSTLVDIGAPSSSGVNSRRMSAQKSYDCLSFARRIGLILPILLLLFVLVGSIGRLVVAPRQFLNQYGLFFVMFLLLFMVYLVPASRMCRRIEVGERFVRFVQLIGSHTVAAGSILKIAPSIWRPAVLSIRHEGGTVAIPSSFDGFSEVISAIREQNPSAQVRGC